MINDAVDSECFLSLLADVRPDHRTKMPQLETSYISQLTHLMLIFNATKVSAKKYVFHFIVLMISKLIFNLLAS